MAYTDLPLELWQAILTTAEPTAVCQFVAASRQVRSDHLAHSEALIEAARDRELRKRAARQWLYDQAASMEWSPEIYLKVLLWASPELTALLGPTFPRHEGRALISRSYLSIWLFNYVVLNDLLDSSVSFHLDAVLAALLGYDAGISYKLAHLELTLIERMTTRCAVMPPMEQMLQLVPAGNYQRAFRNALFRVKTDLPENFDRCYQGPPHLSEGYVDLDPTGAFFQGLRLPYFASPLTPEQSGVYTWARVRQWLRTEARDRAQEDAVGSDPLLIVNATLTAALGPNYYPRRWTQAVTSRRILRDWLLDYVLLHGLVLDARTFRVDAFLSPLLEQPVATVMRLTQGGDDLAALHTTQTLRECTDRAALTPLAFNGAYFRILRAILLDNRRDIPTHPDSIVLSRAYRARDPARELLTGPTLLRM